MVSSNGSIRGFFIFTFLHKVFCIFNVCSFAKTHLPQCSDGPGWLLSHSRLNFNDLNKKESKQIYYIKSLKFKRLWLSLLQIYLSTFCFYEILGVISHWSFVKCIQCVIADKGWIWAVFLKWQLIIERPPHLPSQQYKFSPGTLQSLHETGG